MQSDFDFYESFIHKRKRSIRFPAVEFYNSSTITALENQFSSITDFSRTIKCSKLALRVTLARVWWRKNIWPINGVYDTIIENPLDVVFCFSPVNLLLNLPNNNCKIKNCNNLKRLLILKVYFLAFSVFLEKHQSICITLSKRFLKSVFKSFLTFQLVWNML